jgi:hypothetical protein
LTYRRNSLEGDKRDMAENDIRKTNVTLSRTDIRAFKRLMLDLEEKHDFPIDLKESHCLNAAVQLIIRSASPELIEAYANEKNLSEDEKKEFHALHEWFMSEFVDMLKKLIDTRIESDKRRVPKQEI